MGNCAGAVRELRETPLKPRHRFVEFFDVRDAARALRELYGKEIFGKRVVIEFSRPGGQLARRCILTLSFFSLLLCLSFFFSFGLFPFVFSDFSFFLFFPLSPSSSSSPIIHLQQHYHHRHYSSTIHLLHKHHCLSPSSSNWFLPFHLLVHDFFFIPGFMRIIIILLFFHRPSLSRDFLPYHVFLTSF